MPRPAHCLRGVLILGLSLVVAPVAASGQEEAPAGGLAAAIALPQPADAIAPKQLRAIRAAIDRHERRQRAAPSQTEPVEGPFLYPFFPQAGILGRDLFLSNFTDQDERPELVLDWDCSGYTYDGHHGHDSLIRSFREQEIGVPVFAVRDGVVVDTHDGEPDMNTEWNPQNRANYVVLDHGDGYYGLYLHFKRDSVAVAPGQVVTAGTQIGLTGSSGISSWPHLHFESWRNGLWFEPSAGSCRPGDSLWAAQPPVFRDFYVADFFMVRGDLPITNHESFLLDTAERAATFVRGFQRVSQRLDLRNLPEGSTYRMRVLNPRRAVVLDVPGSFNQNEVFRRLYRGLFWFDLNLDTLGIWRFQLDVNDARVIDAPFAVVANTRQLGNRPPNRISARVTPSRPQAGQVLTCEVQTSLIFEDPDYDVVAYRYEWRVNNRLVRAVTSAALTDLLAAGMAGPRDRVSCRVTPTDGRGRGRAALAFAAVEEP